MAKQNIESQVILNQFPDAFVVFINLDDQGLPIRDTDYANVMPEIEDIEQITLNMGATGKIGQLSIKINNDNNKYFVKDDIDHEIELLKGGQIVVATREVPTNDGETIIEDVTYETLPIDLIWKSGKDFLENRVYEVPDDIEKRVAKLKLKSMGINIDKLTSEQEKYLSSWQLGT